MGGEHVGGVRGDRDHPGGFDRDGYWYYCGSARAYYPYVGACPEGWTPVVPR